MVCCVGGAEPPGSLGGVAPTGVGTMVASCVACVGTSVSVWLALSLPLWGLYVSEPLLAKDGSAVAQ